MEINLPLWLTEKIGPGSLQPTSTSRQDLINGQFGNSASALFHFQSSRPVAEVFTFGAHAHIPSQGRAVKHPRRCRETVISEGIVI